MYIDVYFNLDIYTYRYAHIGMFCVYILSYVTSGTVTSSRYANINMYIHLYMVIISLYVEVYIYVYMCIYYVITYCICMFCYCYYNISAVSKPYGV